MFVHLVIKALEELLQQNLLRILRPCSSLSVCLAPVCKLDYQITSQTSTMAAVLKMCLIMLW